MIKNVSSVHRTHLGRGYKATPGPGKAGRVATQLVYSLHDQHNSILVKRQLTKKRSPFYFASDDGSPSGRRKWHADAQEAASFLSARECCFEALCVAA